MSRNILPTRIFALQMTACSPRCAACQYHCCRPGMHLTLPLRTPGIYAIWQQMPLAWPWRHQETLPNGMDATASLVRPWHCLLLGELPERAAPPKEALCSAGNSHARVAAHALPVLAGVLEELRVALHRGKAPLLRARPRIDCGGMSFSSGFTLAVPVATWRSLAFDMTLRQGSYKTHCNRVHAAIKVTQREATHCYCSRPAPKQHSEQCRSMSGQSTSRALLPCQQAGASGHRT